MTSRSRVPSGPTGIVLRCQSGTSNGLRIVSSATCVLPAFFVGFKVTNCDLKRAPPRPDARQPVLRRICQPLQVAGDGLVQLRGFGLLVLRAAVSRRILSDIVSAICQSCASYPILTPLLPYSGKPNR